MVTGCFYLPPSCDYAGCQEATGCSQGHYTLLYLNKLHPIENIFIRVLKIFSTGCWKYFQQGSPLIWDSLTPSLRQVETSLWPSSTCFLNFGVLPLTRKPSFRSSWNRKLVNFDFLIFFEQKNFFEKFFLVKNYEISDFVDSSYGNKNQF